MLPKNKQLLNFHHLVLLEDKNEKVVVDFVPLTLSKSDIFQLIKGNNIPAKIRIRKIPSYVTNQDMYSYLCSEEGKHIQDCNVKSLSLKIFLYRINNWYDLKKNNYTLNLYKRNCQHYRHFVEENYIIYLGKNYLSK